MIEIKHYFYRKKGECVGYDYLSTLEEHYIKCFTRYENDRVVMYASFNRQPEISGNQWWPDSDSSLPLNTAFMG